MMRLIQMLRRKSIPFASAFAAAVFLVACQTGGIGTEASVTGEGPPVVSIRADNPLEAERSQRSDDRTGAGEDPLEDADATEERHDRAAIEPPRDRQSLEPSTYRSVEVDGPYVAITFDDGPHPQHTPRLLDMLKERGIKATFYVVGRSVASHPEIVERIVREGHELGNHTWDHPYLTRLGASGVKSQMDRTAKTVGDTVGVEMRTMRPPYGATNASLNRRMNQEMDMDVVMWSVDPQDWRYRNSARVASFIIENAKPGDIILAHDIHATTVAAMPRALDALAQKGLQFVTVSELIDMGARVREERIRLAERESAAETEVVTVPEVEERPVE